jgi:hypothetical protein
MDEPRASRPHMPGYGTLGPDEGTGLLPWSWAEERLVASRNYWVATVSPDGRPHVMPVWGVWDERALWFSSAAGSRKARNLSANEGCTVATEDGVEPVVVEGSAGVVTDPEAIRRFVTLINTKYETHLDQEFEGRPLPRHSSHASRPRRVDVKDRGPSLVRAG